MARDYEKTDVMGDLAKRRHNLVAAATAAALGSVISTSLFGYELSPTILAFIGGFVPAAGLLIGFGVYAHHHWTERERKKESDRRGGKPVLGLPPKRTAFQEALSEARSKGKKVIDKYLVGFELNSGEPLWVDDDELCTHAAVFAKTGVGKTLWLQSLMCQQLLRGRASGFTFIDAKRDMGTLADVIMMCLLSGRIEDLIVVDPFDPVCSYNFVFTTQRADVKARKVLRCGLPPTSDQSATKHYDRLAADAVYRCVRAMESFGLAWSVRDIAVALSAFQVAYPRLRQLLHEAGSKQALVELGHLSGSYRNIKGQLDTARLTDNLRGIASELHSIANSEAGEMFCVPRADLSLTDAILRGKIIYYMLPRLEEAESAARMVKVFREDLEVSIGEITSNRHYRLEDPHMVIVDEGGSTFGPTWANLFELARKGRFALLFGTQSVGTLTDSSMGLSEQFYERVMANVNLKVIMRIGDNRTAEDMAEWIGSIKTTKKTLATGLSSGVMGRELTKGMEMNRRSSDAFRDGITLSEDEEELVSAEELKHEMSAEKGLAWFDLGDGRLRKGRAFWFNAALPAAWEGREYLAKYESVEADEIGLAEWVDEHILSTEQSEVERELSDSSPRGPKSSDSPKTGSSDKAAKKDSTPPPSQNGGSSGAASADDSEEDSGGAFRFNLMSGMRGRPRAKTFVTEDKPEESEEQPSKDAEPKDKQAASPEKKSAPKESPKGEKDKPKVDSPPPAKAAPEAGKPQISETKKPKNSKEPQAPKQQPAKSGPLRFGKRGGTIVEAKD